MVKRCSLCLEKLKTDGPYHAPFSTVVYANGGSARTYWTLWYGNTFDCCAKLGFELVSRYIYDADT
jgi:hypothetical protein